MPNIDNFLFGNYGLGGRGAKPTFYAKSGTVTISASGSVTITLPEGASEFIAAASGGSYPYGIVWDGQSVTSYPEIGNNQGYMSFNSDRTILTIRGSSGGSTVVNYATVSI